jgi:hypothetical protein
VSDLAVTANVLPPAPPEVEALIRQATAKIKPHEGSFRAQMEHVLHGGMYARTCRVPGGQAFTSVLIKIPTIIAVHGDCCVCAGDGWRILSGYNVLPASSHRIQAYVTVGDTEITMFFPSDAETVEQAEAQFTDEWADLLSRRRREDDVVIVTGVKACQE